MKYPEYLKNLEIPCVLIIMGLLYVFLPSVNHSGDTFEYACNIRNGENLFRPHHLLYNAFYFLLTKVFAITETLWFICLMNALFAVACLLLMNVILAPFLEKRMRLWMLIFLGSCFGFMRYATTGETYIVPLFFSLLASWLALSRKNVFLTGLVAAIACLFHQIHFFWWLGLLYFALTVSKDKRLKVFILYGIASCIVPIVYFLAFYFTNNDSSSVFEFIVHDYVHSENVEFSIKTKALLLTPISFVRTFFQIHGYMLPFIQKFPFSLLFILCSIVLGVIGCFQLKYCSKINNTNQFDQRFAQTHLLIFVLQLLFAFISDGNAEFMVMLPFALALFVFIRYSFRRLAVIAFASGVLIWNLVFGILPYHFLELMPEAAICRYIKQHPNEVYYIENRQTVSTKLHYELPDNTFQIELAKKDNHLLDSLLRDNQSVISDILTPRTVSRASFVNSNSEFLASYNILTQDTIPFDLGILILSKIKRSDKGVEF
jgi:hypothetical protein